MSDTQMLEERLRGFVAAADDADWQDVLRRAGETPQRAAPSFTRRRIALALAACHRGRSPGDRFLRGAQLVAYSRAA
jgi:hypothetical protein